MRVALDSSDALEDIRARYEGALSAAGWQGEVSVDNSTVWTSDYRKDQRWVGVSLMVREDNSAHIIMTIEAQPK